MFNKDSLGSGMIVRSADGDKLGKVVSFDDSGLVVEKGIFFPKDFTCSFDQIDTIMDGEIYLKWGTDLVETNYDTRYGAGSYAKETSDEALWQDYDYNRSSGGVEAGREHMSIPLREEELHVEKKGLKETGRIRIVKTVKTEDKTFTVPLRREEVRIERVPAGELRAGESFGDVSGSFEDKTVTIPVREEEVEITKRPVVKEALKVTTESKIVDKTVSGEVKKEDARIEREGLDEDLDEDELKTKKAI